jgi:sterol 14alpha-demethylase
MDASYKDGRTLSDDEITGMLIAMLFAGHHTSSATLAWSILELTANPDLCLSLAEELEVRFGRDGPVSFEALKETGQLDSVVREVLRLHPPLMMLIRKAIRHFDYGTYRVPRGSFAITSPPVSHALAEYFPEPSRFEPDRHLPGQHPNLYSYVPFGGGHHRCPGMRFGLQQIKATLSILLRQFEIRAAAALPEPDYRGLVVIPKQPRRISYQRKPNA